MGYSEIAQKISASPTLALNKKFAVLKAKGDPVIHLGGGEPQTKAPAAAITASATLLNTGKIRYAPADGTKEMKQAVIGYTEAYYHKKVLPENILISSGAKQAIMVAMQAILNPRDEVLFPAPYWVSYPEMPKLAQAVGVPVYAKDGGFQPTIRDIEQNITPKTKAVILNTPNNPSGVIYDEAFIAAVVALCEKKNIWLIMDDIYHRLIFDGKKCANPFLYLKNDDENTKLIVINGVSKQYAMTGFRIGWAVGNKKVIGYMANIQGHQTSGPGPLPQKAAIGALTGAQLGVENLKLTLENNRNILIEHLNTFKKVKLTVPDGAFYCLADFSAYMEDSTKLSNFLIDKVQTLTMPGVEFGMEGYLRISYCGSIKDIIEGIERIKWALEPNSPDELYIGEKKIVRDWEMG
jgi:aspartate aminotransferase